MNYSTDSQVLRTAWERDQTKATVTDRGKWPLWPTLPLKNRSHRDKMGFPMLGYILDELDGINVYLGNSFSPSPEDTLYKHYSNVEELVDDGWIVD